MLQLTKTLFLDLLHSFVRKIRAIKIMWNDFNSSHYQSAYSNRRSLFKWFYLNKKNFTRQASINACVSVRYPLPYLNSQASSPFSEGWKPLYQIWMEAIIPRLKGCLLDSLDWVPNRGACIVACLSDDVTRSFMFHDIKLFAWYAFHNHIKKKERTQHKRVTRTYFNTYMHRKKGSRKWASNSKPWDHEPMRYRCTNFVCFPESQLLKACRNVS